MWSYWLCASPGISQRRTGSKNHFVCSAEKVSVDMVKITPDHTIAGHHAQSHATHRGIGVFALISARLGAGRGLRHGWESTVRVQLFLIFCARVTAFRLARKMQCGANKVEA